jgi:hypothetical protein
MMSDTPPEPLLRMFVALDMFVGEEPHRIGPYSKFLRKAFDTAEAGDWGKFENLRKQIVADISAEDSRKVYEFDPPTMEAGEDEDSGRPKKRLRSK